MLSDIEIEQLLRDGLPSNQNYGPRAVVGYCPGYEGTLPTLLLREGSSTKPTQELVVLGELEYKVETLVVGSFRVLQPAPFGLVAPNMVYVRDPTKGTAGAIVRDPQFGDFLLSCDHVLLPDGLSGYPLLDGSNSRVGRVDGKYPLREKGPNRIDMGLAVYEKEQLTLAPYSDTIQIPSIGDIVSKFGASTGCTSGTTRCNCATVKVEYLNAKTFTFSNQLIIEDYNSKKFCDKGDSGSLVVRADRCPLTDSPAPSAVALLFARSDSNGFSVASPLGVALAEHSLELVPQP
ncbi:MAG: hypothetical protein AAGM22_15225 [Acidobacteriota bacterium]